MKLFGALLLCCALLCNTATLISSAQTPTQQDDDVIRVETDLTNLFFTATNKQKAFVTSLREEDLRITEDGVEQKILTFQRETDRPLAIAFLIDVSTSQERTLPQEKAAARGFIETAMQSSKDQAAIIPFTGSAFLEQGLTRDVFSIYRALDRVEVALPAYLGFGKPISGIAFWTGHAGSSTRRFNSDLGCDCPRPQAKCLRVTRIRLNQNRRRKPEEQTSQTQRRHAIILLTDGHDTTSRLPQAEAINRALAAETIVYAIGIGDNKYEGINREALNAVATGTGGRAFFPKREADLKNAFLQIEQELRSQYLIAYSSTNKRRDGGYRQMRVEIKNPQLKKEGLQLRHRPGYFSKSVR